MDEPASMGHDGNLGHPDLTLVLPLYNEGPLLEKNLPFIHETLSSGPFSFEILLIDDCSRDETAAIGRRFAAAHPSQVAFVQHDKNQGRGATVAAGFRRGRGTVVGYIDVDCEASPQYILEFMPDLLAGRVDGITGHRRYRLSWRSLSRVISSLSYRFLERLLLGRTYADSQTGYKLYRREAIGPLLQHLHDKRWFWDTEIMAVTAAAGLSIEERQIHFQRNPEKQSTVRLMRDSLTMLLSLAGYRRQLQAIRSQLQQTSADSRSSGIEQWYGRTGWTTWYARLRSRLFRRRFEAIALLLPQLGRCIDIGCGYGLTSNLWSVVRPQLTLVGIDTDAHRIEQAQRSIGQRQKVSFQVADAGTFLYQPGDTVILVDVLHHIPYERQEDVLSTIARNCAPNGRMLVADVEMTPRWKYWIAHLVDVALYPRVTHSQFRSREEMHRLFERSGWQLTHEETTGTRSVFPTRIYAASTADGQPRTHA